MFKKTLIALALTTAAMSANAALKVTTDEALDAPFSISSQGLPATGVYELAPGGDLIEVEFVAADASALTTANFLVVEISGGFYADSAGITVNQATGTLAVSVNMTKSTSTKLYFDITNAASASQTGTITLDSLDTLVSSGSTGLSLKAFVETGSGVKVDSTISATTTVATVANQWSVKVGKLNAEVNVAKDNEEFTLDFADSKTTDTLTFTYKTIADTTATPTGVSLVIDGNFAGIDSVTGFTINTGKTQATKNVSTAVGTYLTGADAIVFTLASGDDAAAVAERSFTASINASYTDSESQPGSLALLSDADVGGFELNSTSTTINYAPFGPNTQLILNATSTFTDLASVDITYVSPVTMKSVTLTDIGTVAANTVTKLGDIVSAAILDEEGITSGKTSMTISVNAPAGKVTFFAGFKDKVSGSRMALEQVTTTQDDAATAATASTSANTTLDTLTATVTDLATVVTAADSDGTVLAAARAGLAAATGDGTTADAAETTILDAVCDSGSTSGGISTSTIANAATATCL
jgi:hypothetical protein